MRPASPDRPPRRRPLVFIRVHSWLKNAGSPSSVACWSLPPLVTYVTPSLVTFVTMVKPTRNLLQAAVNVAATDQTNPPCGRADDFAGHGRLPRSRQGTTPRRWGIHPVCAASRRADRRFSPSPEQGTSPRGPGFTALPAPAAGWTENPQPCHVWQRTEIQRAATAITACVASRSSRKVGPTSEPPVPPMP